MYLLTTYVRFCSWIYISIYSKGTTKNNNLSNVFNKCRIWLNGLFQYAKLVNSVSIRLLSNIQLEDYILTSAIFVRGPKATTITFPGYRLACWMRNSAAFWSIGFPFGAGKFWFPSPSVPWTKSAIRSFVPFFRRIKQSKQKPIHKDKNISKFAAYSAKWTSNHKKSTLKFGRRKCYGTPYKNSKIIITFQDRYCNWFFFSIGHKMDETKRRSSSIHFRFLIL